MRFFNRDHIVRFTVGEKELYLIFTTGPAMKFTGEPELIKELVNELVNGPGRFLQPPAGLKTSRYTAED
jgi:hypothetical protein